MHIPAEDIHTIELHFTVKIKPSVSSSKNFKKATFYRVFQQSINDLTERKNTI